MAKELQKTDLLTTNNLINSKFRLLILTCKITQQITQAVSKLRKKILPLPTKKMVSDNSAPLTNLQRPQLQIHLLPILLHNHHFRWNKVCLPQIKIKKKTTCLPKLRVNIKLTCLTHKTANQKLVPWKQMMMLCPPLQAHLTLLLVPSLRFQVVQKKSNNKHHKKKVKFKFQKQ